MISFDDVCGFLDTVPLSVGGSSVLAILSYQHAKHFLGSSLTFKKHIYATPWLSYVLIFVAAKSVNRVLTRLVRNHGWAADPPVWSEVKGKGDVVLITGGSNGIGKEVVELLAKKTGKIAVLDLAEPSYNAPNVKYYKCDISDPEEVKKAAVQIRADIGDPTILVNNAGIGRGTTLLDTTAEQFLLTYKVNVLGGHNILREFLPHIISINHGHVMTVASVAGYMTFPQLGDYACSKAAALALHETLTEELVHRYNAPKVRTSVICPMKVSTAMGDSLKDSPNQFTTPTLRAPYIASRMVAILESGLSDHLIAPTIAKVIPFVRAMPVIFGWLLRRSSKAEGTLTDEGREKQRKIYTILDKLDEKHGLEKVKMA